jgi:hypothetical protein
MIKEKGTNPLRLPDDDKEDGERHADAGGEEVSTVTVSESVIAFVFYINDLLAHLSSLLVL